MLTGSKGALDIATDARHVSCVLALPVFSRCAYGSGTAARAAAAIRSACIRYSLLEADPSIAFVHLSRLRQILVAATLVFWLLVDSASRTILQTLGSHLITFEERAAAVDKMSLSNLARPLAQKLRQASTPASQQMRGFAKVPTAKGSQLESMPDPVKNFWEAPSTPYMWKHSHQYGLLLTVGGTFMFGLYKVMMNQQTDKSGKVTN